MEGNKDEKQRKESSCAKKGTVDTDDLLTSRNGDSKIKQIITITNGPLIRIKLARTVELVHMNIYQNHLLSTISMQIISSIHKFILMIQQILGSHN